MGRGDDPSGEAPLRPGPESGIFPPAVGQMPQPERAVSIRHDAAPSSLESSGHFAESVGRDLLGEGT